MYEGFLLPFENIRRADPPRNNHKEERKMNAMGTIEDLAKCGFDVEIRLNLVESVYKVTIPNRYHIESELNEKPISIVADCISGTEYGWVRLVFDSENEKARLRIEGGTDIITATYATMHIELLKEKPDCFR